ncbi:hypothetical protein HOA92_07275 [archaeon]|jgi:hypothetical protein|nr:hypothetical protein [archaeon]MBT6762814.1 hypothetical protein [archaeon]
MHQPHNNLTECEINTGDLVLLVNENFSDPQGSILREPTVILSRFTMYLEDEPTYFRGTSSRFIREQTELIPGIKAALIERGLPYLNLFGQADRIYIGEAAVRYGLQNDPIVTERLSTK